MAVREKESTPLYVPASFTNGNGKGHQKESPRRERSWRFWVGMTLGAVLVVGWVGAAAFFVGQETRPAEAQVKERIADRVAEERFAAGRERARALKKQKKELDRRWEAQMKRNTKRAYGDGRRNGYRDGRSDGYAAGARDGRAQGERRGRRKGRKQARQDSHAVSCIDMPGFPFVC